MYQEMLNKNPDLFAHFQAIHDQYTLSPSQHQTEFNEVGAQVVDLVTEYENKLCRTSEKGQYAKYSHNLSDKFHELVRSDFPKIDDVGLEIETTEPEISLPARVRPRYHTAIKPPSILDLSPDDIVQDALDEALGKLKKTNLHDKKIAS